MKTIILILGIFLSFNSFAKSGGGSLQCFWVSFSDKENTIYSVDNPIVFLSERAILRRSKQKIEITEEDFPVNANYLTAVKNMGATIKFSSRWFNAAAIVCRPGLANQIGALPFVNSVDYVGKHFYKSVHLEDRRTKIKRLKVEFPHKYGYAKKQIEMLKGVILHEAGLTGKGKVIAVLDAGFAYADDSPFFEHLQQKKAWKYAYNVMNGDGDVFDSSMHGTQVLSVMGAKIPGVMVGTAPDASYVCIKTEDTRGEFRMDECNWIAGLEYADSLGVDVVNSSLGYTTFDDHRMNYNVNDLDGDTALATQAAERGFAKGMIIVNSAGNEGQNSWKEIAIPADGPNVLAVGAVNPHKDKCDFSSTGWVEADRVKPDVAALGLEVAVVSGEKDLVLHRRGTSYSAPLVSGLVAVLWQAFPNATNKQILEAVRKTASEALHPNIETGFGIPNFSTAFNYLLKEQKKEKEDMWVAKD